MKRLGARFFLLLMLALMGTRLTHALTSSDALPKGVRAAALVYGFAPMVDSTFDAQGKLDYLVSPLNRSITFEELAEFEPDLQKLKNVIDTVYPSGIGNQLIQANLYADAEVFEQRYVPALLWGLSDRWSVGILVPVVKRQIESSFKAVVINQGQDLKDLVGQIPELSDAATQLANAELDTNTFVQKIFYDNGYKSPANFENSGLGDIELETRYLFYRSDPLNMSARLNLKIPTGSSTSDIANLLDKPIGNGHYSLKAGLLQDFRPFGPRWIFSSAAFLAYNFASDEIRAVRRSSDQLLPNLNDPYQVESLRKRRGMDLSTDMAISRSFFDGVVWVAGSYQYFYHGKDRFEGSRNLLYSDLSKNTQTSEHGVEASIEFSSIQLFLKEEFPLPGKMVFAWYQPLQGKNALYAPYGRMDFALLF